MPGTKRKMERCREAFEASEHTLDSLSDKAGIARSTLYNYLKGVTEDLKPSIVNRIADALEIAEDEPEAQPVAQQILTHCDRCRADNAERFEVMRSAYEDRIVHINEKFTHRIDDLKEHHAEVQGLLEKHHAEREGKLQEELAEAKQAYDAVNKRNRIMLGILIALVGVIVILAVIDLPHEQIGWLPYLLRFSNGAH